MGNYYSDYTGSDEDDDGIGDTPYTVGDMMDDYPLMEPPDSYNLQTWWLANPTMYRGDMSQPGGTITIGGSSHQIWAADQPTLMDISFGVGNQVEGTTWTGQVIMRVKKFFLLAMMAEYLLLALCPLVRFCRGISHLRIPRRCLREIKQSLTPLVKLLITSP